jgi:hypothetical protein
MGLRQWEGSCTGAASTCTLTSGPGLAVTAFFAQDIWTLTIDNQNPSAGEVFSTGIDCGNGKTACATQVAGQRNANDVFQMNITAVSGHKIATITGCDKLQSLGANNAICSVNMTSNRNITVSFN